MTPRTLDLLDEAARVLRDTLAKTLSGESRYLALLTANAVAMVRRESTVEASLAAARDALSGYAVAAIRNGSLDDDESFYVRLCACAALEAWIANPNALSEAQQRRYLQRTET